MTEQLIHTFTQAYIEMGYSFNQARSSALKRVIEDDAAMYRINACVDLKTAREFIWLLEAAQSLCAGNEGRSDAMKLTQQAFDSLVKSR